MRYHKTPWNQRTTFTYDFADGSKFEIKPGQEDVTDIWIKRLHGFDDAEVYNNIKNARPEPTAEEKAQRKEWEKAHPGEKAGKNWNISLDSFNDGESTADRHAELADSRVHSPREESEPDDVERLHEVIAGLSQRQQAIYRLVWEMGFSNVDAAKVLGITEGAVRKHRLKIKAAIVRDKILQEISHRGTN